MKSWLVALAVAVAGAGLVTAPFDAEARRIGGGKAAGMQRQAPPPQPAQTPAQSQATPATPAPTNAPTANAAGTQAAAPVAGTAAAAGAGAAAAKSRSWLGPVAGIAAGLGIAALLSHLGLGEAFANLVTMILLAAVAFFVLRWVMRRLSGAGANAQARSGLAGATAGAGTGGTGGLFGLGGSAQPASTDWSRPRGAETSLRSAEPAAGGASAFGAGPASTGPAPGTAAVPADLDTEAFARIAKMIFIRLQAANDAGNLDDLRKFTTPELFASLRLDLQERGGREQRTDVLQLDSEVVDAVEERGESIVSVRFHGLIREESEGVAEPFDEVWHLVRPLDGSREWAIAGITPQTVH